MCCWEVYQEWFNKIDFGSFMPTLGPNCMEQRLSSEADSRLASQEITAF
jgi:hypothetical protein